MTSQKTAAKETSGMHANPTVLTSGPCHGDHGGTSIVVI